MTKLIAVLIIVVVLYIGWHLFLYWDKVNHEEETSRKQAVATMLTPEQLPGLPQPYDLSYRNAVKAVETQGPSALKKWLKEYDKVLSDPRKAWIQLDYCVLITHDNPAEARQIFKEVKDRTPPSSQVWPRIKQLEKTYE
jgi:hypothetical protein